MKHRIVIALIAFATLLSPCVSSAHTNIEALNWYQITGVGPIYGSWKFYIEAQPRIGTDPATRDTNLRTFIVRSAIGYQITEAWSLWMGYAYQPNFNPSRYENRVYQQSLYQNEIGPFKMANRTRLEERMIQDAGQPAMRILHQLWLMYPLPRWPQWGLVAADEPFINLNTVTNGPIAGFDQNRLYLGVSRQLGPHLRVEVDYLNQFVLGHDGADDTVRNGAFVLLVFGW